MSNKITTQWYESLKDGEILVHGIEVNGIALPNCRLKEIGDVIGEEIKRQELTEKDGGELDCIVNADGKEIYPENCLLSKDDLHKIAEKSPRKWRLANWEKANAQMNKTLTPIIVDGRNIYEALSQQQEEK